MYLLCAAVVFSLKFGPVAYFSALDVRCTAEIRHRIERPSQTQPYHLSIACGRRLTDWRTWTGYTPTTHASSLPGST